MRHNQQLRSNVCRQAKSIWYLTLTGQKNLKSELATKLAMQCGEPENYTRLIQTLKLYLAEVGVDVVNITLHKNKTSLIPMIQIESVADNVKKQSAIYPVSILPGVTDIIPVFTPNITTVEGEDIVISYVTDDMFVRSVGGVVELQWFRDDAIIAKSEAPNTHCVKLMLAKKFQQF